VRGMVEGLESAVPLLYQLPGPYQEDGFAARFVAAFDDALAPVVVTLDNLAAYVDPDLAPEDFVAFLAGWVVVELDEQTGPDQRRRAVRSAVAAYRRRGTTRGLTEVVRHAAGGDVEVTESGGARWSAVPGSELPGDSTAQVTIRVSVDDPDGVDLARLRAVVDAAKPAHVPHVLEVVRR
jgi:phage tail-like protein